jgi:hypothetical protein
MAFSWSRICRSVQFGSLFSHHQCEAGHGLCLGCINLRCNTLRKGGGIERQDHWRLAPSKGCIWRLPLRRAQVTGKHSSARGARCADLGLSGRPVRADDHRTTPSHQRGTGPPRSIPAAADRARCDKRIARLASRVAGDRLLSGVDDSTCRFGRRRLPFLYFA